MPRPQKIVNAFNTHTHTHTHSTQTIHDAVISLAYLSTVVYCIESTVD